MILGEKAVNPNRWLMADATSVHFTVAQKIQ
jgi:hypothetical protein